MALFSRLNIEKLINICEITGIWIKNYDQFYQSLNVPHNERVSKGQLKELYRSLIILIDMILTNAEFSSERSQKKFQELRIPIDYTYTEKQVELFRPSLQQLNSYISKLNINIPNVISLIKNREELDNENCIYPNPKIMLPTINQSNYLLSLIDKDLIFDLLFDLVFDLKKQLKLCRLFLDNRV